MRATPGLLQSLGIQVQRRELDAIARRLGTPLLFLKAAWSDPVLYGGRGERTGWDVDVLVHPEAFEAFAEQLQAEGYERTTWAGHTATNDARREWTFAPPPERMRVDLHRGLADTPWFRLDVEALFERAVDWDSPDGPIASLCAEDQVVYAAAHLSNHRFQMSGSRHVEDIERLLAAQPVDWAAISTRARESSLEVPLHLLATALAAGGSPVGPEAFVEGALSQLRLRWLSRFVGPSLDRRTTLGRRSEVLALMPALSGRLAALPAFLGTWAIHRLRDRRAAA